MSKLSIFILLLLVSCNPLGGGQEGSVKGDEFNPGLGSVERTPFTTNWPFDIGTSGSYTFTTGVIEFDNGNAKLTEVDQLDDDISSIGFGGGLSSGVIWDLSNSYLRLGNNSGCNGSVLACANQSASSIYEINSTWTPRWTSLFGAWKLNGNLGVATAGSIVPATVGPNGTTNGGLSYIQAKFKEGITGGSITLPLFNKTTNLTISAWVYLPTATATIANIFGSGDFTTNGYGLYIGSGTGGAPGNKICLLRSGVSWNILSASPSMVQNQWTHIALTRDTTTWTLYVNGASITTGTSSPTAPVGSSFIGGWGGTPGYIDEVAVWNTPLSPIEISSLYDYQSVKYSGLFVSRIMDAFQLNQNWESFTWQTTLPFLKELPDYAVGAIQNESSIDYVSLVGSTGAPGSNNLMSNIVGLWHLNEPLGTTGASSVKDDSGKNNHGTPNSVTFGNPGSFGKAPAFNGTNSYISLGTPADLAFGTTTSFTVSAWVKVTGTTSVRIISIGAGSGFMSGWALLAANGKFYGFIGGNTQDNTPGLMTASTYNDNKWHLVTWVVNQTSKTFTMYVDGLKAAIQLNSGTCNTITNNVMDYSGCTNATANYHGTNIATIGSHLGTSAFFNGSIDEVAIWSRPLHEKEVLQLYRRGANRLKHQVRICTSADCSDDSAGANWKGPDGTNQTYFSELNNNSTPLNGSGDVRKGLPSLLFSAFTNPISTGRYFQYRTIFESDDNGTGCDYGSGPTWCSPELKSVRVDPVHYDSSAPTIIGKNGVSYYSLSSFVATLGTGDCSSGVVYNLGVGASSAVATWYWWNGSNWVTASGAASQANTSSDLADHINTFGSEVGIGTVYVKAFLQSTGTSGCALDNIELSGQQ